MNVKRRHLNSGQLAFVALEAKKHFAREAKERQVATLKRGNEPPVREIIPEAEFCR